MDEEKTNEESIETTDDSDVGSEQKNLSITEQANAVAERLEKANAERKEILDREEEMYAHRKLGGNTEAGATPEKPKEETAKEYAEKVMKNAV